MSKTEKTTRRVKAKDVDVAALQEALENEVSTFATKFIDGAATMEQWKALNDAIREFKSGVRKVDRSREQDEAFLPRRERKPRAKKAKTKAEAEDSEFASLSVTELKARLTEHGEATTGKKADLVARLEQVESGEDMVFEIEED